ncbi:hypothetical protein [Candidatus Amarobacter glycogenicus]|uniref:hypothetical protein n=1 Tax=Candidatus Amarobacter glycogenicus TaxID=3140699 RepID=UPI0031362E57|nr:hypothetical protein [Dehalococcoidia bacterium]
MDREGANVWITKARSGTKDAKGRAAANAFALRVLREPSWLRAPNAFALRALREPS